MMGNGQAQPNGFMMNLMGFQQNLTDLPPALMLDGAQKGKKSSIQPIDKEYTVANLNFGSSPLINPTLGIWTMTKTSEVCQCKNPPVKHLLQIETLRAPPEMKYIITRQCDISNQTNHDLH